MTTWKSHQGDFTLKLFSSPNSTRPFFLMSFQIERQTENSCGRRAEILHVDPSHSGPQTCSIKSFICCLKQQHFRYR